MAAAFVDHVMDLLGAWGGVTAGRMFGGHGIYRRGVIFGLVIQDVLYLKTDEVNRPEFEASGQGPFTYQGKGKVVTTSYWEVPSHCLDDAEELQRWSEAAWAVSQRKTAVKRKKAAPKKQKPVARKP